MHDQTSWSTRMTAATSEAPAAQMRMTRPLAAASQEPSGDGTPSRGSPNGLPSVSVQVACRKDSVRARTLHRRVRPFDSWTAISLPSGEKARRTARRVYPAIFA